MDDNLKLFMFTVEEYEKFSSDRKIHKITDDYNDKDYISVNTRLMLLRKYGKRGEPVAIDEIIKAATTCFPQIKDELDKILMSYQNIETQNFEYRLATGETMDLYTTIEDVIYGLYLHADFNRINRLRIQNEGMRFVSVRKYVEELENVLFELYDLLKDYVTDYSFTPNNTVADVVYFGDDNTKDKNITSQYWQNLSGSDINLEETMEIFEQGTAEDNNILSLAITFIDELKKETINVKKLEQLIFSGTRKDWGDFSLVREYYYKIPNAGLSSKVRYNERHDMAYVRLMPNVDNPFKIESPQLIPEVYEICFYKKNDEIGWKIYSFGGHLEDVLNKE